MCVHLSTLADLCYPFIDDFTMHISKPKVSAAVAVRESFVIKAKEMKEEADAVAEYSRSAQTGTTSLGDLLKEQMGDGNKDA